MEDLEEFEDQESEDTEELIHEYYEEQDNLKTVREWFKHSREFRRKEAERLEQELAQVENDLEEFENELQGSDRHKRYGWIEPYNGRVDREAMEVERLKQSLRNRRNDILHRIRNLIRWDRDDLQWIGTLEGRQRARERASQKDYVEQHSGYRRQTERQAVMPPKRNRQHKKRKLKAQTNVPKAKES